MVVFDDKNQLNKYKTVDDILCKFCEVRYLYYKKRKAYQIDSFERIIRFLGNKERFVPISNEAKNYIDNLERLPIENQYLDDEDPKKSDAEGGYDYLLRMPIRSFTKEKVKNLQNDILSNQKILDNIIKTTEKDMWIKELDDLEINYNKWVEQIDKEIPITKTKKK